MGAEALPRFGAAFAKSEIELARAALLLRAGRAEASSKVSEGMVRETDAQVRLGAGRLAGEAALARADARSAVEYFEIALRAAAERKDPYQAVLAKIGRARALRLGGSAEAAAADIATSLSELEQIRRGFHSFEMRIALYGSLQSVFDEAVEFFAGQGLGERALAASEAGRARAMLDLQGKVEGVSRAPVGTPKTLTQIQAGLSAQQVAIVYHQLPARLVAWSIGKDNLRMHVLPLPARALHEQVQAWRQAIERLEPAALAQAQALQRALVAPLGIPRGASLVFVPHRSLHLLPFQALHDGQAWLIELHPVATSLSASLLEARAYPNAEASLTALGNPDLGRAEWALPGAEREVQALQGIYARSRVFLRQEAGKSQLMSNALGAEVVHIAAHAVIDEVDPMYSVIKLAPVRPGLAARPDRTGDLEARELATMDLSQAQLIALSACSSGVGTVAHGDEFMGFKRALFSAGARSALVSLWLVDDDATEVLMTSFHRAWRKTSRIHALQTAQLEVLRQPKYAHPYFWAPFALVGDPG